MPISLLTLLSLVLFAVVASQPIFYALALTRASNALSAPAYVELRNAINEVMKRRLPAVYVSTLAATIALLVASALAGDTLRLVTTALAILGLAGDTTLMLRESVRINQIIEGWTPTDYPQDWQTHRARWFAVFSIRQVLACGGFASLLAGAELGG